MVCFDASFCCVVLQFDENLEQWPHLNELVHCYTTDWVKDENKYGHYESIGTPSFHNQIYEGPDTDIETGISIFFFILIFNFFASLSYQVLHSASNFRKIEYKV